MRNWWLDRASARTPEEREQHYQDWLKKQALQDSPDRRELFMRRYRRSAPPTV